MSPVGFFCLNVERAGTRAGLDTVPSAVAWVVEVVRADEEVRSLSVVSVMVAGSGVGVFWLQFNVTGS